jgi:hypothetical protein
MPSPGAPVNQIHAEDTGQYTVITESGSRYDIDLDAGLLIRRQDIESAWSVPLRRDATAVALIEFNNMIVGAEPQLVLQGVADEEIFTIRRPTRIVSITREGPADGQTHPGRPVHGPGSVPAGQIDAAHAGTPPTDQLTDTEDLQIDADISDSIEECLSNQHYGEMLAAEGVTTVALDSDGHLIEDRPDGTSGPAQPDMTHPTQQHTRSTR